MIVSPELPYFWRGPVYQGDKVLEAPLHWRDPRVAFVCGRSDLLHPDITDAERERVLHVMASCPQHEFLVLTKRSGEMARHMGNLDCAWPESPLNELGYDGPWPLPNVGLGVTICNQDEADEKIPHLLACPAAFRYVSFEPMLGPVNVSPWLPAENPGPAPYESQAEFLSRLSTEDKQALDWVIVGGESGKDARPMHPDWARGVRDQCVAAHVPFFFKQFGEWAPCSLADRAPWPWGHGRYADWLQPNRCFPNSITGWSYGSSRGGATVVARVGKKKAGRMLDGREWNELSQIAQAGG